jgi:hypothetical protein
MKFLLFTLIISLNALASQPISLPDDPLDATSSKQEMPARRKPQNNQLNKDSKNFAEKHFQKTIIGKVGKWTAIKANPNSNIVCYAILYAESNTSNTKKPLGNNSNSKPYIAIHYFSEGRTRFSAYAGYELLNSSSANVSIDSTQHKLSASGEYAITNNANQDAEILQNLIDSNKMMIRSEGKNYSYSIDFYDISEFAQVLAILQDNCDSTTNNSSFKGIVPTKKDLRVL